MRRVKRDWDEQKETRTEKFHQIQAEDVRETKGAVAGQGSAGFDSRCTTANRSRIKRLGWN
jgi:hypothetical protein